MADSHQVRFAMAYVLGSFHLGIFCLSTMEPKPPISCLELSIVTACNPLGRLAVSVATPPFCCCPLIQLWLVLPRARLRGIRQTPPPRARPRLHRSADPGASTPMESGPAGAGLLHKVDKGRSLFSLSLELSCYTTVDTHLLACPTLLQSLKVLTMALYKLLGGSWDFVATSNCT